MNAPALPAYVTALQSVYGPPSDAGFGSAVFFEPRRATEDLGAAAFAIYRRFVGRNWSRAEAAWRDSWRRIHARGAVSESDILAELGQLEEPAVRASIALLVDALEQPETARAALAGAFDDPAVRQARTYTVGDGEAMSGLLLAAERETGATVYLVVLMD